MDSISAFVKNLFTYSPDEAGWWILAFLDILFLAFLIYQVYRILIKSQATQLLHGLVYLGLIYIIASILKLKTVLWIVDGLGMVIIIVIAIVFQPELRKIFTRLARGGFFKTSISFNSNVENILEASKILSESKRGALVVFERKVGLKEIIDSGTELNSEISSNLLVTIFQYDTALHDGAVIVRNGKIASAGCFLPLSEQSDIKKSFGTRHRAALGATESSDAIVLIVSEESGAVSLAYEGNLYYDLSAKEIKSTLLEYLEEKSLGSEDIESEEGGFGV